ncbi:hypothetical protein AWZ03_000172 [Drosophila navojoa]|uniref:DUF4794 domain-containing protein n=1 Tax=Drosophila navojoa TaxID=7232 RepID=A0A484BX02_DRONA|nr:uncharacterized protein LOC108650095 [Drosophila navojoa]TDG53357.1 hypothetical protein AWZ03_000172 [Drosophila navojoa]
MRWFIWALLAALCLHQTRADVSQLVKSGNGFVYDVPKVSELELELNNEFPTGQEFPQDAIPVAPSDAELGQAEAAEELPQPSAASEDRAASDDSAAYASSKGHGYAYRVPSRRFKS